MANYPRLADLRTAHPEWQRAENLPDILSIQQIAVYTNRSCDRIADACRDGSLRAMQQSRNATWKARIQDVQRWVDGLPPRSIHSTRLAG